MLISKDEEIKSSAAYIGYLILKSYKRSRKDKITIFDIFSKLRKKQLYNFRQIIFGLMFLYSLDLIDFEEPYITFNDKTK